MANFEFTKDPFDNFSEIMSEAEAAKIIEPNAMTLSTIGLDGTPNSRQVLFKGILSQGFSFFTNFEGQKSLEIFNNPNVCLNFFWAQLEKQIRIKGIAEKATREESEKYFKTRVRESKIGAWASKQSKVLSDMSEFKNRYDEFEKKFKDQEVPCPPNWGGFIVKPTLFEFWFGKKGRLHERYVYEMSSPGNWQRYMKFP